MKEVGEYRLECASPLKHRFYGAGHKALAKHYIEGNLDPPPCSTATFRDNQRGVSSRSSALNANRIFLLTRVMRIA